MLCPNCGAQLSDGMLFCPECGSPVGSSQFTEAIPVSQYAQAPAEPQAWPRSQMPLDWEQSQPQEPAWEQPQQTPAEKAPKKKIEHKRPGAGVIVLCIFLCLLLFLSGFYAAILGTIRLTLTRDNIEAMVEEYDADEITMPGTEDGEVVSLAEFIEEIGGTDFKKDYGFSRRALEKLLDKSYLRDFISDTAAGYADNLLRGKRASYLSRESVLEFFEDHDKDIFETVDYSFLGRASAYGGELYYDKTKPINTEEVDAVFEQIGLEEDEEASWKWIGKQTGVDFSLISTLLSIFVLIGAIALAVILIVLIFLANKKTPYSAFTFTGVTCMILGGLLTLAGGAGLVYSAISKITLFKIALNPFALRLLIVGAVILLVGVLLLFACRKIYDAVVGKRQPAEPAAEPQLR